MFYCNISELSYIFFLFLGHLDLSWHYAVITDVLGILILEKIFLEAKIFLKKNSNSCVALPAGLLVVKEKWVNY